MKAYDPKVDAYPVLVRVLRNPWRPLPREVERAMQRAAAETLGMTRGH